MSNTFISWSMAIFPWLTLLLLPKEDVKRYMPVTSFSTLFIALGWSLGNQLELWSIREPTFPFPVLPLYFYGMPPFTLWAFKLAYGRFKLYAFLNFVFDIIFIYLIAPWLGNRGIIYYNTTALNFFFPYAISFILYGYQLWQEDVLVPSHKTQIKKALREAVAKPLNTEEQDKETKHDAGEEV
jgi:hypothetical protein